MKIIFIDDEPQYCTNYLEHLQHEFSVEYADGAVDGINLFRKHHDASLLILDVMMPIPARVPKSKLRTRVDTGFYVIDKIKVELVETGMPVILLTNRAPDKIRRKVDKLNRELKALTGSKLDQIEIQHKLVCFAKDICRVCRAAISRSG